MSRDAPTNVVVNTEVEQVWKCEAEKFDYSQLSSVVRG